MDVAYILRLRQTGLFRGQHCLGFLVGGASFIRSGVGAATVVAFSCIFSLFLALACGVIFSALDTSHLQLVPSPMSIAVTSVALRNIIELKGRLNCDHRLA